jgi:hypothetical protein
VNHLPVPETTHTVELEQLKALNQALASSGPLITADTLGLADVAVPGRFGVTLPGSAVLVHLGCEGPPEFPYIRGYFRRSDSQAGPRAQAGPRTQDAPTSAAATFAVDLHTQALKKLSRCLGLRQSWGF